jgi:hypothetical protein
MVFHCGFPAAEGVKGDLLYSRVSKFLGYSFSLSAEGSSEASQTTFWKSTLNQHERNHDSFSSS